MKNRGLAFKLILFILSGTTAVFLGAFAYYHLASRQSVLKYVEENAGNLARSSVHQIETVLRGVEKGPLNLASILSMGSHGPLDVHQLAERLVATNPEIYGAAVAFEPYAMIPGAYYFSPYCHREADGTLAHTVLGDASYRYFTMDWYQIPKEMNRAAWTEPYYDEGGGDIMMATFSAPFYNSTQMEGFRGVVTADVALSWLCDLVSGIRPYRSGYAFLISRNGVFITHPIQSLVMKQTIFSIAEERENPLLRKIGQDMIHGSEGMAALQGSLLSGKKSWLYYAPLSSTGWSLGIVIPEEELFADVTRLGRQVVFIGLAGLLLIALIVMLIAHQITNPLKSLAATTVEIARGNLDTELPRIRTHDEIGRLAASFEGMRVALKEYVKNLTETTAAKERIESELKIARTIQMSFLPKAFPPFSGKESIAISAVLEPARDIGGDLYDFFMLDEDHLFFAVGDVSGKGIPAALFMAVTKTLLKGIAEPDMDPSEVLEKTNVELCRENDSMMFVTIFCGILNLRTGLLKYSNAGHEPPILIGESRNPQWVSLPDGLVLGVMEDSTYETRPLQLRPGETLLLYTDGVTEAMDGEEVLYSGDRLIEEVRLNASLPEDELTHSILESVKRHAGETPQSDDITLLVLTFKGTTAQQK